MPGYASSDVSQHAKATLRQFYIGLAVTRFIDWVLLNMLVYLELLSVSESV